MSYEGSIKIFLVAGLTVWLVFCVVQRGWSVREGPTVRDDLLGVSFPDSENGWICGRRGIVLHTRDGGRSWTRQNSRTDYTLTSIFFVDSNTGWAVGDEGAIIHTKDGGNTWVRQKSPVTFYLMDVCFVSPLSGWIVTEQSHILHTEDGGVNWRIQFRDKDIILKAVSFADSLNGWVVGEYGYIYFTRDGGATWTQQAGFFKLSEETDEIEGEYTLFGVDAVDDKTAWAVGIDGKVVKTTDAGESWRHVLTGAPGTQIFCVAADRRSVLMGGKGIFLVSGDAGETWLHPRFAPTVETGWIYGLARRGLRDFVAVGREGSIYGISVQDSRFKVEDLRFYNR